MVCPWENFGQTELHFCEALLCSWVRQPGNAYSSFAYIAVGLALFWRFRRRNRFTGGLFGASAILLGFGSFAFHATGTKLGGELDYLGMFSITAVMTGLNLRRLMGISRLQTYWVALCTLSILQLTSVLLPHATRLIFSFGSPCCILEMIILLKMGVPTRYTSYWVSWVLVGVAFAFWWGDQSGVVCFPENHWVSGHMVWHLLTASAFVPLAIFYTQFHSLQLE